MREPQSSKEFHITNYSSPHWFLCWISIAQKDPRWQTVLESLISTKPPGLPRHLQHKDQDEWYYIKSLWCDLDTKDNGDKIQWNHQFQIYCWSEPYVDFPQQKWIGNENDDCMFYKLFCYFLMNHIARCEENNAIVIVWKQLASWLKLFLMVSINDSNPSYLLESPEEFFKPTNAKTSDQWNQNLTGLGCGSSIFS